MADWTFDGVTNEWRAGWATVWMVGPTNFVWHTWGADGVGGENDVTSNVAAAFRDAELAAIRQGFKKPAPASLTPEMLGEEDRELFCSIVRVLEYLEWHGEDNLFQCRACRQFMFDGHTEDCPLGRTVSEAKKLCKKYGLADRLLGSDNQGRG